MKLNKREYNSDRRRKYSPAEIEAKIFKIIRENITPIGDGNLPAPCTSSVAVTPIIRENITPIGDGNFSS